MLNILKYKKLKIDKYEICWFMLINYYNNALDNVPNTSGFHGLFTSPLAILNMVKCGSYEFNYCLKKNVIDKAIQLGILSPLNEAKITNEKEEKVAEEDRKNNSTSPFTAEAVEGSRAHEMGHLLGFDHSNRRADPCFKALDQGLITATSDTFQISLSNSILAYVNELL